MIDISFWLISIKWILINNLGSMGLIRVYRLFILHYFRIKGFYLGDLLNLWQVILRLYL